ncbi:MAG: hypothetical protein ACTSVI_08260, partial [Promethearchaeota archaeon]
MAEAMQKSSSQGQDPYYIRKKKLYKIISKREFFRRFDARGWECQTPYLLEIYEQYIEDKKFRKELNKYLIYNETVSWLFKRSIEELPASPWNMKIGITAETGMGKSRLARKFNQLIIKAYGKAPNYIIGNESFAQEPENRGDIFVCYDYAEAIEIAKRDDIPGSVIFLDETPEQMGQGSVNIKKQIKNLLRVSARANGIHFIYINPEDIKLKTNWHVQILGINRKAQLTLAMLYIYMKKSNSLKPQGVVIFDVTESPELTEFYEKTSLKVKREMLERGCLSEVSWKSAESDVKNILDVLKKEGFTPTSKKSLESFVLAHEELKDIHGIF